MLGNVNGKNVYTIPVTWEVYDTITVRANDLLEAYRWVVKNEDTIPLGTEPEYVDGSYKVGDIELARMMNKEN